MLKLPQIVLIRHILKNKIYVLKSKGALNNGDLLFKNLNI